MQINWDYYILNCKNLLCKLLPSESIFTNFWCRSLLCDCFNSTKSMDRSDTDLGFTMAHQLQLAIVNSRSVMFYPILKSLSSLNNSTCITIPFCLWREDKFHSNVQLLEYPSTESQRYFCLSRPYCLLNIRAHKGLLQFQTFGMNVKYIGSSLRSFLYNSY